MSALVSVLLVEATETENCYISSFTEADFGRSIVNLDESSTLVAEAAENA